MVRFAPLPLAAAALQARDAATDPASAARPRRHAALTAAPAADATAPIYRVFPSWARAAPKAAPSATPSSAAQAWFAAGAGLALFDAILRDNPVFAAALRQRLALRAAATSAKILRLREDDGDLRDAQHLAGRGADPGRAGRLHHLWRLLAAPSPPLDGKLVAQLLALIGLPPMIDAADLATVWHKAATPALHPLAAAIQAALTVSATLPPIFRAETEILALWVADLTLASRLGWKRAVPLLATRILDPDVPHGQNGRRLRPGDALWPQLVAQAYNLAASDGHAAANDLARRAAKLLALAPKLRAKGAGRVIELLLADDAVSPARAASIAGLSDRAARRLFDRLVAEGGVREVSGRANFRLYGL